MLPNMLSHTKLHFFYTIDLRNNELNSMWCHLSGAMKTEGCWVEECAVAYCVCRTFWVMLGRWICGRSRVSSAPVSVFISIYEAVLPVTGL